MGSMTMSPSVESFFKDGNWVLRIDLPGVDPKNMDVSVAGNTLTIQASRERLINDRNDEAELREVSYGRFERSVTLPEGVKSDQIKAHYQNGVLDIIMPAPTQPASRKIPIEIGADEKKQLERQAS
jgi:HSP20 family protein